MPVNFYLTSLGSGTSHHILSARFVIFVERVMEALVDRIEIDQTAGHARHKFASLVVIQETKFWK